MLLILFVQLSLGMLTIPLSLGHLDGSMMVKFMNYVQGVVMLRADPVLIAGVPLIFRLHILLGFTIFLIFPFTRLVHVWSAPVGYLFRNYQVVRTKKRSVGVAQDSDLPPYVARPASRSEPVSPSRRKEAA